MKGHGKVLAALNGLLAEDLAAVSQYVVHGEMAENEGYGKLKIWMGGRAITAARRAEKRIGRIPFPEGAPMVRPLNSIRIGAACLIARPCHALRSSYPSFAPAQADPGSTYRNPS